MGNELALCQRRFGGGGKSLYDIKPDPRVAESAKAWSFLLVEAAGTKLTVKAMGSATEVLDRFVIDRSAGELPANLSAPRRARIMRMRR